MLARGCGDDDEEPADTATAPPRSGHATETGRAAETRPCPRSEAEPSPEDQPGGAGDEEPAQSQAAFTGRGGRVTPAVVRVAPFIAIRLQLRSADGAAYGLSCRGRTLRVDADIETASTRIAGRRAGGDGALHRRWGRTTPSWSAPPPSPVRRPPP